MTETIYKGYFVTEDGKVFSNKRGKIKELKLENHSSGYLYVNIYQNGKRKHVRVHRLIALTFIENPNNLQIINHKNGIKNDNNVSNLEWTTVSYNTKHAYNNGLAKNASGFDDSQSNPLIAINKKNGEELIFGSASIASKELCVNVSTIMRQLKNESKADYRSKYIFKRYMECND